MDSGTRSDVVGPSTSADSPATWHAVDIEIAIILIVVLVGLVVGDLALVRAISRRRNNDRR
ncbi:MAG TPA: hypothetical protein VGF95_16405 [Solirubrobacteraceae bacterium]